jgi:hypothetical protein
MTRQVAGCLCGGFSSELARFVRSVVGAAAIAHPRGERHQPEGVITAV